MENNNVEFWGANLRTLIDTSISLFEGNLNHYNDRQKLIDSIEERLTNEFNAICLSNGTTFTKTFTPSYNFDNGKTI